MTDKRYGFTLGLHNEFKDIVDHCRQDKHISVFELMKQVNEQDKEFKKIKRENEQLKDIVNRTFNVITESEFAKSEYCNALLRLLGEENDVDKAKQRIKEFLE